MRSPLPPFAYSPHPSLEKGGFALVLALVLLAFLASLMLGMGVLVSVEVRQQATVKQISAARTNALLGLQIALGEIQKNLGPDSIVTGDASLLTNTVPGKNAWLGAWDNSSGTVHWLVSGTETPAESPDLTTSIDILKLGDTYVPKIQAGTDASAGSYAYWTADLSQKARIDLRDERIGADGYTIEETATITAPRAYGLQAIPGFNALDALTAPSQEGADLRASLEAITAYSDLAALTTRQHTVDFYHDLTAYSYGLQSNVVEGGLKQDLSTLVTASQSPGGTLYPDGPHWSLLQNFLAMSESADHDGLAPAVRNPTTTAGFAVPDSPTKHGVAPLVFFWQLGMGVVTEAPPLYAPNDIIPLKLRLEPIVVMLNPYDVPLKTQRYILRMWSGGGSYYPGSNTQRRPALGLEHVSNINGARTILTPNTGSSGGIQNYGNYLNEWLPDFTGHGAGDDGRSYQMNSFRVGFTASFEPGEIKVFSLTTDTTLPGSSDGWVLELEEVSDPFTPGRAFSGDISGSLQKVLTGELYDQMQNESHHLKLRLLAGSVVMCLYFDSVDNENSVRSNNLTTTQRISFDAESSSDDSYYIGAYLKGPNDLVNKEDDPPSDEGLVSLRDYNLRSHYQSQLYKSLDGIIDFKQAPTYSPFSDIASRYHGVFTLWDSAIFDGTSLEPRMVLFHIPSEPMTSIAELQHVDFSSSVYAPAYAVGNSHANPWIPANQTAVSTYGLQDYSYLLNEALWDHYFFSTLETRSDGSVAPRNPRMKVIPHRSDTPEAATLLNPGLAAGHLLFDGPFNVNTDSVDAWAALLASGYQFPTRIQNVHSGTESLSVNTGSAFARSVLPSAGAVPNTDPVDANNEYWLGYRDLTDTQIRNLAGQIVYQIRQHGPFTSLAAFINRDLASTDADAQLKGLLQRAIDSQSVVTLDGVEYQPTGINPLPDSSNAVEAVNSALDYQYPQAALGLRSSMAPGYLTQADLLTKLGPQLTVRGDSFLIRAYGEAVDPISGAPVAFAQCEAIVQRLPEYLADPSQPPTEAANASNTTLGRKFEVVSFRWLNEESL